MRVFPARLSKIEIAHDAKADLRVAPQVGHFALAALGRAFGKEPMKSWEVGSRHR